MRIGILGPLEVSTSGRTLPVGGARLRGLLILLALEAGRVVPAERLIDDLWEDRAPAAAPNALQSLISRLRAAFDEGGADRGLIESHAGGYRLALPREEVDAHDFEAAVVRARGRADPADRSAELAAALKMWRGPALADVAGLPFADGPVARLEGLRLAALEDRIDADLALGRVADLIPELEALAAAEPLREPLRARLMRALYADGRQADALGVYEDTRRALRDALGVDPSPDLESIHLAMLRHDPELLIAPARADGGRAADAPAPSYEGPAPADRPLGNLRARLTSFIGRDGDLRRIGKLLESSRLVTLTGPGGAGKTRLSLECGDRQIERMADGVWFVGLAAIVDPAELPHAVLAALGLRESTVLTVHRGGLPAAAADAPGPLDRLAAALAGKHLLLILDNCEHLLDAAAGLADRLLADCPGVRVLTTSREPLAITGETLWPVEPLPLPPPGAAPDDAMTYPAVRLLADRGAAVRPGFAVTEGNVAEIVRICRALDGIPLAIELAGARLRVMSPGQIAHRLDDRFRLLSGGSRTALPRHQTLRAVVEWSWELLDDAERTLWRRMSVLSGGATLDSAEAICGDPGSPPGGEVLDALTALVDKSLVDLAGEGEPRYRMLETIRAYGLDRLAEAGERERVRRAHAAYFIELAEAVEPELYRHDQIRWFDRLTAEHDNLHAALRWSIDHGEGDLAVRFCAALAWYWMVRGHSVEGSALIAEVLAMPELPAGQPTALAAGLGAVTSMNGGREPEEVKGWVRLARDIVRGLDDDEPLHPLLRLLEPALAVITRLGPEAAAELDPLFAEPEPWTRAFAHFIRGQVLFNYGMVGDLEAELQAALREFRGVGDRWGLSVTMSALADLYALRGEHGTAAELCERALALSLELGVDRDNGGGYQRVRLANQISLLGDQRRADRLVEDARRAAERSGSAHEMLGVSLQLVEFARRRGDVQEERRALERAEAGVAEVHTPPQVKAMVVASRGLLEAAGGDLATAGARLAEAIGLSVRTLDHPIIAHVLDCFADLAVREGDPARAAELLGTAIGLRGVPDLSSTIEMGLKESLRAALGEAAFDAAYRRGAARTLDDVLDLFGLERPTGPII